MELKNILRDWKKSFSKDPYSLIEIVVVPWFEKKLWSVDLLRGKLEPEEEKKIVENDAKVLEKEWRGFFGFYIQDKDVAYVKDILEEMLSSYGRIFIKKIGVSKGALGSIKLYYDSLSMISGYYSGRDIYINLAHNSVKGFLGAAEVLLDKNNKKPLSRIKIIEDLFIPKLNHTPTLIHELEHARRREKSEKSYRNKCVLYVGKQGKKSKKGKKSTFDVCANEYARKAIKNGLLREWKRQVVESAKKISGGDHEKVLKLMSKLIDFIEKDEKYSERRINFLLKKFFV